MWEKIPGPLPPSPYYTASDRKLGGAWDQGYISPTEIMASKQVYTGYTGYTGYTSLGCAGVNALFHNSVCQFCNLPIALLSVMYTIV